VIASVSLRRDFYMLLHRASIRCTEVPGSLCWAFLEYEPKKGDDLWFKLKKFEVELRTKVSSD
jgi:hypothetical protein